MHEQQGKTSRQKITTEATRPETAERIGQPEGGKVVGVVNVRKVTGSDATWLAAPLHFGATLARW
jgi:hypothetical protein